MELLIAISLSALIITLSAYCLYYAYYQLKALRKMLMAFGLSLVRAAQHNEAQLQELTAVKEKFNQSVLYDGLTGLPAKQIFEDRLRVTVNQSKRYQLIFAVMFLDLDGFKIINDALGHDVGDELLKIIATRLKDSIRQVDTVSRFGSDEFVLILPQLTKGETSAYIARRLLEAIAQPIQLDDQQIYITASIGIALYPADGEESRSLLKNAANALHQAKAHGRNSYQFYRKEMLALSQRELILNSSLQNENLFRDFIIYYRPEINTESKKILTMQAVLHWKHADFGLLKPNDFFSLAERNGKIVEINEWIIHHALTHLQQWKRQQLYPTHVSIPVSLRQMENPQFPYRVSKILQEIQMDPAHLVLEISEDILLTRIDLIEKAVHMLKHLGVLIAISDFGAGHLSLQQLKRFPFDYLKISETLVRDITINTESTTILQMIVALAASLQVEVIAEGVETAKQKQQLKDLGCHIMQGSLLSAPLQAEDFTGDTAASLLGAS